MHEKPRRQRTHVSLDWKPAFLSALEHSACSLDACKAVPVDPSTVYRERQRDPEFAAAYEAARQVGAQLLEQEATRRAKDGCKKLVLCKGQPVRLNKEDAAGIDGWIEAKGSDGTGLGWGYLFEVEKSDRLLELLLKRHFPDQYREKLAQVNVSASASANSQVLGDDELRKIQATREQLLQRMQQPGQN